MKKTCIFIVLISILFLSGCDDIEPEDAGFQIIRVCILITTGEDIMVVEGTPLSEADDYDEDFEYLQTEEVAAGSESAETEEAAQADEQAANETQASEVWFENWQVTVYFNSYLTTRTSHEYGTVRSSENEYMTDGTPFYMAFEVDNQADTPVCTITKYFTHDVSNLSVTSFTMDAANLDLAFIGTYLNGEDYTVTINYYSLLGTINDDGTVYTGTFSMCTEFDDDYKHHYTEASGTFEATLNTQLTVG